MFSVASWAPYCKAWDPLPAWPGPLLSDLRPCLLSHLPPFQPLQAGDSSHSLSHLLCIPVVHLYTAVPSIQDGLPVIRCLQVPSYSLKLSPRIVSSGPFSLSAPPCPELLAPGVSVSSRCRGWQCRVPNHIRVHMEAPSFPSTNHVALNKIRNLSGPR